MTETATSPATTAADLSGEYTLDVTHTRLGFVARHAMITKVRGAFTEFEGSAHLDFADPTASSVQLTMTVASITTGQAQRDEHLRTNDFFDAPTYPTITFRSTAVEPLDGQTYRLVGDLTIKDVTKPVAIDFVHTGAEKDPFGNLRVGFEGSTVLNRKDWGLTWNAALESGGVLVSDKITLELDVSAVRSA